MMPIDTVDFTVPEATLCTSPWSFRDLRSPFWERFFDESVSKIFRQGTFIVDIGGGLRIDASRGNDVDQERKKKLLPYLQDPRIQYRITDYTAKYRPDFVEDLHRLSFADNSVDGLFCLAVLEHVYDPKKAAEEIVRVLKQGSHALLYVPFVYRYHATVTEDYRDYYRFSKDGIAYLFRMCSKVEICPVRGIFESLAYFTPLRHIGFITALLRSIDWATPSMRRISERQTSGYFVRIRK